MRLRAHNAVLALVSTLVVAGCDVAPKTVRLDFITRGSCGRSFRTYDISCVAALDVKVVDATGAVHAEKCTPVLGSYTIMEDLVADSAVTPLLEAVDARDDLRVEFRAYHAFDKQPCEDPRPEELMMWGTSDPVDFLSGSVGEVAVQFECRPFCDCAAFDQSPAECPAVLQPGACTPLPVQLCRQECDADSDCFGGAPLFCDDVCTAPAGEMCDECTSGADCDSGLCVQNLGTGESFCALVCPPEDGVEVCPPFMACRRIDGVAFAERP